MKAFPIDELLPRIVAELGVGPSLVLRAPTGAGKTTRVPPALLAGGVVESGQIVMLEPRRLAARAAARRIADELGSRVGNEIGYWIRFDRQAGPKTRILVVTEGILVQMLQRDPFLEGVDAVVFDEFHERNLNSDLSLAMVRRLQREVRPDLKVIVMSATLDPEPIAAYLGGAAVVESAGRLFPVDIKYLEGPADDRKLAARMATGVRRALADRDGDVLAFLPGVAEIRQTADLLADVAGPDLEVLPLYGDLPPERQDVVLRPGTSRRVVLATNVAETSITIQGISSVVDSGLVKVMRFDPAVGLDRLELTRVSRASAEQRAGRAGRQGPGFCLRLWTLHDDRTLVEFETPEIRRVDLAAAALQLLAWGETDLVGFGWFEAPAPAALARALALLEDLGACRGGCLTGLGRTMARLPVHPRLARLLIEGHAVGQIRRAAKLAALLSERDVVRPLGRPPYGSLRGSPTSSPSDLLDRLDTIESLEAVGGDVHRGRVRQVQRIARQLEGLAERQLGRADRRPADDENLLRTLLSAYPDRLACRRSDVPSKGRPASQAVRGVMVGGRGVRLADTCAVRDSDLFLCIELDAGRSGKQSEALVRRASAVEPDWLPEAQLRTVDDAFFDDELERVVGRRRTWYRDLMIVEVAYVPGADEASRLLTPAAARDLERALPLNDGEVSSFLVRLASLRQWMPELALPAVGDSELRGLLPGLAAGRRSFAELKRAPVLQMLKGSVDHKSLKALEKYAPTHLEVPSGSRVRLNYQPHAEAPILAVRIQQMFGLDETPTVAGGQVQVVLHLLAPNHRSQQVTRDLASFWRSAYGQVRKELRARYPRHAWPEDPLAAAPENRPRRRH